VVTACGRSWYVGEWEECQCPGFTVRPVVCYLQDHIDGLYRVASPTVCPSPRPANLRPCTPSVNHVCRFVWMAGPWSEVLLQRRWRPMKFHIVNNLLPVNTSHRHAHCVMYKQCLRLFYTQRAHTTNMTMVRIQCGAEKVKHTHMPSM